MFIWISQHRHKNIDNFFFWASKMRDVLTPLREKEMKFIRLLFLITLDHFANNFNDAIYCLVRSWRSGGSNLTQTFNSPL